MLQLGLEHVLLRVIHVERTDTSAGNRSLGWGRNLPSSVRTLKLAQTHYYPGTRKLHLKFTLSSTNSQKVRIMASPFFLTALFAVL